MAILIAAMSAAVIHAGTWTPTRSELGARRHHVMDLREHKCLHVWKLRTLAPDLSARARRWKWHYWGRVKGKTKAASSRCLPTSPRGIIRYVFPAATEDAAIRVAGCETGWTYNVYATNSSSGAAGLFQLLPFHWQGRFNPYDPWANSRYAYRLSHAGYDWGAWICQP